MVYNYGVTYFFFCLKFHPRLQLVGGYQPVHWSLRGNQQSTHLLAWMDACSMTKASRMKTKTRTSTRLKTGEERDNGDDDDDYDFQNDDDGKDKDDDLNF